MSASKLVLHSYGIVAANKPLSSMEIEVTPMEDLTMTNGELTDNLDTKNAKGIDADGASFETTVKSSATVTARWLPFSSNRKTAPDVRRGEKIAIWKFADADKYYWSSLEYEAKLRKLETVIYTFSNTQVEGEDSTKDTTYFLEISTHTKMIHFHTSKNDGEPFSYDIALNTKDGNFQIRDDIDNIFFLDSEAKRLLMRNAADSYIDLNNENLIINVVNDMTVTVGGHYKLTANGSYTTTTPKADFVTAILKTSEKFESGADALIGGAMSVTTGLSTGVGGGGGKIKISGGDIEIDGNVTATGNATFTGSVSASNI